MKSSFVKSALLCGLITAIACLIMPSEADAGIFFGNRSVKKSVSVCTGPNCKQVTVSAEAPTINSSLQTNGNRPKVQVHIQKRVGQALDGAPVAALPEDTSKWYTIVVTKDGNDKGILKWFRVYLKLKRLREKTTLLSWSSTNSLYQERYAGYVGGRYPAVLLVTPKGHVVAKCFGKQVMQSPEHLHASLEAQARAYAEWQGAATKVHLHKDRSTVQVIPAQYTKSITVEKTIDNNGLFRRRRDNPGPVSGPPVVPGGVVVDVNAPVQHEEIPMDLEEEEEVVEEDSTTPAVLITLCIFLVIGGVISGIICWNRRTGP